MSDVFDKLAQNVKDISQGIIGQTKTTVTQGKTEIDLLQARNELKKLYTQLGEKVYQNRLYPEADPGIEILYNKIADKTIMIKTLEKSVKDIRKEQKNTMESVKRNVKKTWQSEGEETRTPEPDEDGYPKMKFCSECNIGNHPEAEYCIACGHTLENEDN